MDKVVWKFTPFSSYGNTVVWAPESAAFLSVGLQDDVLVLWALCDPDDKMFDHRVTIVNTGIPVSIPEEQKFLGTVETTNGIVWHVWAA